MNIDDYEAELISTVQKFFSEWRELNKSNSEHYPLEMLEEDWDDQVLSGVFCQLV